MDREQLFRGWPGCTDGNCVVTGPKKGMHTNGGCKCIVNASRPQLHHLQSRLQQALTEAELQGNE